ncbi:hypothetical protein HMN09_00813800 [Mycena chlorophos]|uniref:BTB domain-containing protein n=1 Tax=Mycena chlorophos TaxID=658473 RepID=A0A8H6SVU0_MYCCL|nr:hypothetical protein HMN09_00813800 [Mycena chlorophos]
MDRSPEESLTRAEGLYFADCGLIIRADAVLFRVSGNFLATQSTVFRDLLSFPQPEDAETVDGCPVVRVQDASQDVETFLKALIYPSFFEPPPSAARFTTIASVLRLSHKYDVDWLEKRALSHLAACHPTRLDDWNNLFKLKHSFIRSATPQLAVSVVKLARELSIDWILPTALYRLARVRDPHHVLKSTLDPEDKLSWAIAVRRLDREWRARSLDYLLAPCTNASPECLAARIAQRQRLSNQNDGSIGGEPTYVLPLDTWWNPNWQLFAASGVCASCVAGTKRLRREAQQTVWDELPGIFRLDDWATLENRKKQALQ